MMNSELSTVLSPDEACELLRIGKNRLYYLLQSGKLKGYREGNRWKISHAAIEQYILTKSQI